MSKGFGKTQRRILAAMRSGRYFTTHELAAAVYDLRPELRTSDMASAAQLVATRRALTGLEAAGFAFRHGRAWTVTQSRVLADTIRKRHYLRSTPTRPVGYFEHDGAVICFAVPSSPTISPWLLGKPNAVVELSRMWAPDGHRPNLLTEAIAEAARWLRKHHPGYEAIISYSDPNVGHEGGVYRAASFVDLGQSDEPRYYRDKHGVTVSRRKFHSGRQQHSEAEIAARGYMRTNGEGKWRFARGLTRAARLHIAGLADSLAG